MNYKCNIFLLFGKKYSTIVEKLKSEIKKKEQCITKYELEKQIAEKNKKT